MNKKDIKNLIELWNFLDSDIPSKVFPEEMIRGQVFTRDDKFESIKEIKEYLKEHFLIAFPKLNSQNKPNTN